MDPEQTSNPVNQATTQTDPQDAAMKSGAPQGAPQGDPAILLDARLKELEGFLSERDKEITELKKSLEIAGVNMAAAGVSEAESKKAVQESIAIQEEAKAALSAKDKVLSNILTAYKAAILQAHPEVPEEMVTGNTLEELQGSISKAEALVVKIRSQVMVIPGPAGAPVRKGPDVTAMSSREKIVQGLKRNGS